MLATPAQADAPCGTLVIPNGIGQTDPGSVTSLNPLLGPTTYNQQASLLLYRPLVWIGQNDEFDHERSLAADVTPQDGNTRFVVTLRPWRWSDGAPVTADDVVFCWERIQILGPIFGYMGQGGVPDRIASIRALDASRVEITLKSAVNPMWFTLNGLSILFALPRHAWGDIGRDEMWRRQTDLSLYRVTDGPFRIVSFMPDRAEVLEPNPLYGGHKPTLARLVIAFLAGGSALHALSAGDIDMAHIPPALIERVRHQPGLTMHYLQEPFGYFALTFNFRNPSASFLRDRAVRRALTDLADQRAIIQAIYRGLGQENRVPVASEPKAFRSPAVLANRIPVRFDPDLAEQELEGGGWHRGPDGVRVKDGVRLELTTLISADSPTRVQMLQVLQQDLRRAGILLHIVPVSFPQLMATLYGAPEGWQSVGIATTIAGFPDGTGYFDTNGANNPGGYSNPQMDALIRASVELNGLDAFFAFEDLAASDQPVNILPQGGLALAVTSRVQGLEQFLNPQGYWSPEYLSDSACHAPAPS